MTPNQAFDYMTIIVVGSALVLVYGFVKALLS